MGSLFSSPSPPPVSVPVSVPTAAAKEATTTNIDNTTANTTKKSSDDKTKAKEEVEKNRKGLAQNINTSWRGILNEIAFNPTRKSLLGE